MKIVVKKFGGTSVGSIERIHGVARLVQEYQEQNPDTRVIVVASAMSGETNRLIQLAKSCVPNPPLRELDSMVSTGEQVSIALLSMALMSRGIAAQSMVGYQAKIATNKSFSNAQIEEIDGAAILALVEQGIVPVIAGFQGMDDEGNVTTLGRGGSDITAVAVAAAVKATECFIYTDVEGVYTTDPRIVPQARRMNKVCHEEMLEMASLGAKVLHPRSVYFAMRYEVPLVVLSTFNPTQNGKILGTWIVKEEELMEKPVVTGITYRFDETKVSVCISGETKPSTVIANIFKRLGEEEIFVDMISETVSAESMQVSFTVPSDSGKKAQSIVAEVASNAKITLEPEIAKISIVGVGMRYHSGVAAKMFEVLAAENMEISMIGTSEIKTSVVVPRKYGELAVRALHKAFIEMNAESGEAAPEMAEEK